MITYQTGDIIELARKGEFSHIIHGANCQSTMNSGIAKQLRAAFPEVYEADKTDKRKPYEKIGDFSYCKVGKLVIINAYTQFDYGTNYRRAEYGSIKRSFETIFSFWRISHTDKIATVKIGAGLGGADWSVIEDIINDITNFYGVNLHVLSK